MSDLVDRQAAINEIEHHIRTAQQPYQLTDADRIMNHAFEIAASCIYNLPSAQPERKTGKWIERNPQNSDKCRLIECDQCGFSHIVGFNVPYEHWIENRNFCERCGAKMEGNG